MGAFRLPELDRLGLGDLSGASGVGLDDALGEVLLHVLGETIACHDGRIRPAANVRPLGQRWQLFEQTSVRSRLATFFCHKY